MSKAFQMKTHKKQAVLMILSFLLIMSLPVSAFASDFKYSHDPMQDDRARYDIVVNPDAVYGFSPNPDSESLGEFAKYDWSDEELVEASRKEREHYHERVESELLTLLDAGRRNGDSVEKIARTLSERRNAIRLEEAEESGTLEETKKSNLDKYGNADGPTPEYLYEKYGSWEMVATKAFSINVGMDVCLGLYDKYYDAYELTDDLFARSANPLSVKKSSVTIKKKALLKKSKSFIIKSRNAVGRIVYKPADAASKKVLHVNSRGKVTVKKRTPAGIYKIKITAGGNNYFMKKSVTVKIRIK